MNFKLFLPLICFGMYINSVSAMPTLQIKSAENKQRCSFNIEIADTPQSIETGLMYRKNLPQNRGMLFDMTIVPNENPIAFWMKNTFIPLDILFIDADNVIFDIKHNAKPHDTTLIWPSRRPTYVLEINGGKAEDCNISLGDVIHK